MRRIRFPLVCDGAGGGRTLFHASSARQVPNNSGLWTLLSYQNNDKVASVLPYYSFSPPVLALWAPRSVLLKKALAIRYGPSCHLYIEYSTFFAIRSFDSGQLCATVRTRAFFSLFVLIELNKRLLSWSLLYDSLLEELCTAIKKHTVDKRRGFIRDHHSSASR